MTERTFLDDDLDELEACAEAHGSGHECDSTSIRQRIIDAVEAKLRKAANYGAVKSGKRSVLSGKEVDEIANALMAEESEE